MLTEHAAKIKDGSMAEVTKQCKDTGSKVKVIFWDRKRHQYWTICEACSTHGGGSFMTWYNECDLNAETD